MEQQERKRAPVFISYSHDSPEHLDRVFELCERLRAMGFDCRLDQHEVFPAAGWQQWSMAQIQASACVLVVCTRSYLERYRQEQDQKFWHGPVLPPEAFTRQETRFVPLLYDNADAPFIPEPLQAYSHFHVADDRGLELLAVYLGEKLGQTPGPAVPRPPLPRKQTFASPLPINKPWRLPGPNSAHFCDRDRHRRLLEGQCRKGGISRIMSPAPGLGRSQLVLQHATKHGDDYSALLWLDWGNEPFLQHELSVAVRTLGMSAPDADARELAEMTHGWLMEHERWLVVLRGWRLETPLVRTLAPQRPKGCMLLMPPAGLLDQEDAAVLQVDALAEKDFLALLRNRTGRRALMRPEREAALSLAEALQHATMLLDVLGALSHRTGLGFQELDQRISSQANPPLALLETCLQDTDPDLRRLLCACSLDGVPRVPEDVLLHCLDKQGGQGVALLQEAASLALAGHFSREGAWSLNSGLEPLARLLLPPQERNTLLQRLREFLISHLEASGGPSLHAAALAAVEAELAAPLSETESTTSSQAGFTTGDMAASTSSEQPIAGKDSEQLPPSQSPEPHFSIADGQKTPEAAGDEPPTTDHATPEAAEQLEKQTASLPDDLLQENLPQDDLTKERVTTAAPAESEEPAAVDEHAEHEQSAPTAAETVPFVTTEAFHAPAATLPQERGNVSRRRGRVEQLPLAGVYPENAGVEVTKAEQSPQVPENMDDNEPGAPTIPHEPANQVMAPADVAAATRQEADAAGDQPYMPGATAPESETHDEVAPVPESPEASPVDDDAEAQAQEAWPSATGKPVQEDVGQDFDDQDHDGQDFDDQDFDDQDFDGQDFDGQDHDGQDFDDQDHDGQDHDGQDFDVLDDSADTAATAAQDQEERTGAHDAAATEASANTSAMAPPPKDQQEQELASDDDDKRDSNEPAGDEMASGELVENEPHEPERSRHELFEHDLSSGEPQENEPPEVETLETEALEDETFEDEQLEAGPLETEALEDETHEDETHEDEPHEDELLENARSGEASPENNQEAHSDTSQSAAAEQTAHSLDPMREALGRAWGRRVILPAVAAPREETFFGRMVSMIGRFFFRGKRKNAPEPKALPSGETSPVSQVEPTSEVTEASEAPEQEDVAPRPRAPSVRPADSEPDLPATAAECERRAAAYRQEGRLREAEPFLARALQLLEKLHGAEHLQSARAANALGELYRQLGELDKAEPLMEQALKTRVSIWGDEHPEVAQSCTNLGSLRMAQGRLAEAEALYVRSLRMDEALFGHEHPNTATDCNNLAVLYFRMERFAEALRNIKRAMAIRELALGADHPLYRQACENCAAILRKLGRNREADSILATAGIEETSTDTPLETADGHETETLSFEEESGQNAESWDEDDIMQEPATPQSEDTSDKTDDNEVQQDASNWRPS